MVEKSIFEPKFSRPCCPFGSAMVTLLRADFVGRTVCDGRGEVVAPIVSVALPAFWIFESLDVRNCYLQVVFAMVVLLIGGVVERAGCGNDVVDRFGFGSAAPTVAKIGNSGSLV